MNKLFLKSDQAKFRRELNCCTDLMKHADAYFQAGEFDKAADCYEDMANSMREIQQMKDDKKEWVETIKLFRAFPPKYQKKILRRLLYEA